MSLCLKMGISSGKYSCIVIVMYVLVLQVRVYSKKQLHLMGFFPLIQTVGPMRFLGNVSKTSAELALEHINKDPTILGDYELEMVVCDSGDREGVAINTFFEEIYEGNQTVIMVIGGLRNEITEILARPMEGWNLLQIAYGSHSPTLSDTESFPNLYRTIPSSNGYNDPRVKMLNLWNWDKVAIVTSSDELFTKAVEDLQMKLTNNSINVIAYEKFKKDMVQPIKFLKDKDARIIIGNFYEYDAIGIFCEAYKAGYYGPDYVWFLYGHYDPKWWLAKNPDDPDGNTNWHGCTPEQMEKAVDGYIGVKFDTLSNLPNKTVSNYTPREYRDIMLAETGLDLETVTQPATYAYDAVWAAALSLNASIANIAPRTLDQFRYKTGGDMTEIFRFHLDRVNFLGVSGPVLFGPNGDRQGIYGIVKNINGTNYDIGKYFASDDSIEWSYPEEFIWAGSEGQPPPDEDITITETVIDDVSMELFAIMCAFSCVGIVMALGFLFFNIYYRNERLIKMSSPNLNDVIIAGCILSYLTVILLGIDTRVLSDNQLRVICQVRVWIFALSFTLSFGAMFSKTWRVYTIFTNKKVQKRVIKDHQLFFMVGVLLLIDVIIIAIWQIVDPLEVSIKTMEYKIDPGREFVLIEIEQHNCWGRHESYFTWTLYIYKGLLLIFGAFITWQTRNVSIPALNDSRYIGLSIYNVVMFSALGVPLSYLLAENTNYTYAVVTGLIVFCTTLTLCLLFFPKVVSIVYGYAPEEVGTRVMSNMNGRPGYSSGVRNGPREERHRQLLAAKGATCAESSISNVYDKERSTLTSEATRM